MAMDRSNIFFPSYHKGSLFVQLLLSRLPLQFLLEENTHNGPEEPAASLSSTILPLGYSYGRTGCKHSAPPLVALPLCFLKGSGHSWACDGAARLSSSEPQPSPQPPTLAS